MIYHSLSNPEQNNWPVLKYPAEPAIGGTLDAEDEAVLLTAFRSSSDLHIGFNAANETKNLELSFCKRYESQYAIAFCGGNTAMDLVLRLQFFEKNDEVICAGATFHGQHLSVIGSGAKLVLADVSEEDFCLSPADLLEVLTTRTKAVIITDIHGACADYRGIRDALDAWASKNCCQRPILISDAARSLGSLDGPLAAKYCDFTVFSLQSKKLISALGEGGVVLTDSASAADSLKQFRSFGLGRAWGSNFKLSKLQAAVALVQLMKIDEVILRRNSIARNRDERFAVLSKYLKPIAPPGRHHTYLYYALLLGCEYANSRNHLMKILAEQYSIGTVVANPPSYQYNQWISGIISERLPVSESLGNRIVCLSIHQGYTAEDEDYICTSFVSAVNRLMEESYE